MSKLKLRIQLDTDFEVDLSQFSFEGMNETQIKKELIKWYFDEIGFGETEISNVEENSIITEVRRHTIQHEIEFQEIELERKLTLNEKLRIAIWVLDGQIGKLNL